MTYGALSGRTSLLHPLLYAQMSDNPQVQMAVIGALSAILGTVVGTLSGLIGVWLTKRTDERKHKRDIILQLALEEYKANLDLAKTMSERFPVIPQRVPPLAEYIIAMSRLTYAMDKRLTPDEVEKEVREFQETIAAARKHWKDPSSGSEAELNASPGK